MPTDVIDIDALDEDEIQLNLPPIPSVPPPSDLEPEELLQPIVDIQSQFDHYNRKHFLNRITNATVEYSTRMTLCAGTCTFRPPNVRIALSEPLLKFRPRSDLLSTLLHEMIHAYLFLTKGLQRDGPDGHGPVFMSHAKRINNAEPGINITPYHEFRDEVDHYRVHHWRCEKCDDLIKRAMNRAPGPSDQNWELHQRVCGGTYIKIAGPPKKEKPVKPPKHRAVAVAPNAKDDVPKGVMKTFRIDDMLSGRVRKPKVKMATCPVCGVPVKQDEMNKHLDSCLSESMVFTQPANPPRQETTCSAVRTREDPPRVQPTRPSSLVRKRQGKRAPLSGNKTHDPTEGSENPSVLIPTSRVHDDGSGFSTATKSDVTRYIRDADALRRLALAPKKFSLEQVDRMFSNPPPKVSRISRSARGDEIKDFLDSIIHPETASSREMRAMAIINPLRVGPNAEEFSLDAAATRFSLSSRDLVKLIQQNSEEDGSRKLVISEQFVDKLLSSKPLSAPQGYPTGIKVSHPLRDSGHPQGNINRKRGAEVLRPNSRDFVQAEPEQKQPLTSGNVKRKDRTRVCPICEKTVEHYDFDTHISSCVAISQGQDNNSRSEKPLGNQEIEPCREASPQETRRVSAPTVGTDTRCPICDVALSRDDLSTHVPRCMASTGLADAF